MNWANRTVFTGDNLDVLRGMDSETVDLIYADPPFNSNRTYSAPIGSEAAGAAFKDTWTLSDVDEAWLAIIRDHHPGPYGVIEAAGIAHSDSMKSYLCMMAIRFIEMYRVLKPEGSLYLHCDYAANSYLRLLLDAIWGRRCFRNEIVWSYQRWTGATKHFQRMHDTILMFAKSENSTFNQLLEPHSEKGRRRHKGRTRKTDISVDGRLEQTYVDDHGLKAMRDVWEISYLNANAKERVGYPTQKPIALVERVVRASSNAGDVVLDPFCGCATALIAAENLTRRWVGIDISSLAVRLVRDRLKREVPLFIGDVIKDTIERTDVPVRTDLVDEVREYLNEKRALYGKQEGRCAGCRVHFELRNLEVDHVVARVKGGPDHITNYQLLCGSCNRKKGAGSQAELIAKLKRDGIIAA